MLGMASIRMKGIIVFMLVNIGFTQVDLTIQNVVTNADGSGSLDVVMTNKAGCSYCSNPAYDSEEECISK